MLTRQCLLYNTSNTTVTCCVVISQCAFWKVLIEILSRMLCLQLGIHNVINIQNDQDNVLYSTLQRNHHVDISAESKYETIQFVQ